jgi:hypothetical protein
MKKITFPDRWDSYVGALIIGRNGMWRRSARSSPTSYTEPEREGDWGRAVLTRGGRRAAERMEDGGGSSTRSLWTGISSGRGQERREQQEAERGRHGGYELEWMSERMWDLV